LGTLVESSHVPVPIMISLLSTLPYTWEETAETGKTRIVSPADAAVSANPKVVKSTPGIAGPKNPTLRIVAEAEREVKKARNKIPVSEVKFFAFIMNVFKNISKLRKTKLNILKCAKNLPSPLKGET
jgi:hypothetical protein